jgi:hypothetical protein
MCQRGVYLAACAALLLAGCSTESETPPAPEVVAPAAVVVPRIDAVEVGVTFNGLIVSALGRGPGEGWRDVRLLPRGLSDDGAFVFDMTALPPTGAVPGVAQRLRADLPISRSDIAGAARVRVRGAEGAIDAVVPPAPQPAPR